MSAFSVLLKMKNTEVHRLQETVQPLMYSDAELVKQIKEDSKALAFTERFAGNKVPAVFTHL